MGLGMAASYAAYWKASANAMQCTGVPVVGLAAFCADVGLDGRHWRCALVAGCSSFACCSSLACCKYKLERPPLNPFMLLWLPGRHLTIQDFNVHGAKSVAAARRN
jgi:hypothetical protein